VAADVEHLDGLLVVPLKCCPRKEHVGHFTEGQSGVRVQKLDARRRDVDVPLGEVRVRQHE